MDSIPTLEERLVALRLSFTRVRGNLAINQSHLINLICLVCLVRLITDGRFGFVFAFCSSALAAPECNFPSSPSST